MAFQRTKQGKVGNKMMGQGKAGSFGAVCTKAPSHILAALVQCAKQTCVKHHLYVCVCAGCPHIKGLRANSGYHGVAAEMGFVEMKHEFVLG